MKRKVIKQGIGGLTISIPKKWAKDFNINPGDEIEVKENKISGDLILSAKLNKQPKKKIIIDINEINKKEILHYLTHIYRNGTDIIEIINIRGKEEFSNIEKITEEYLLGFEITLKNKTSLVLENISEPEESSFETMFRRIFYLSLETINYLKEDYKKLSFNNKDDLLKIKIKLDKYVIYCKRIINRSSENLLYKKTNWEFLTFLMHNQHEVYYLYEFCNKKSNYMEYNNKIQNLIDELEIYFKILFDFYLKRNISYYNKIMELRFKYGSGKINQYIEESKNGLETVIYSYLNKIFRQYQLSSSPILSQIIEEKINS